MNTRVFRGDLSGAAELIAAGSLVAVPTETVYGLAGNGLDVEAVERIYEVKGRPEVKPLSLMVPGPEAMELYCGDVPPQARALAERFWPGPLTIILASKPLVPEIVRAGGATVGLRCPDHPDTLELLRRCGVPLAAPSANPSGAPSPKTAGEVLSYFDGLIEGVIDGGECGLGRESTIIDLSSRPFRILRQGALPAEEIAAALAERLTVIGITGGSGTGKTTALRVLGGMGAMCIDCDELYHELTRSSAPLREAIIARFGPEMYAGGELDRKALGRVVFSEGAALRDLNAITHRFIGEELRRRLGEYAMSGGELAAIDAAALIEGGADELCTAVYGVLAPRELRLKRIMAREGISAEYAALRIDAQQPDVFYTGHCSAVLVNDGSKEDFQKLCEAEFRKVIEDGRKTRLQERAVL